MHPFSADAVLEGVGTLSNTDAAQRWIQKYSAQARVEGGNASVSTDAAAGLIAGNYAFVGESSYAWVRDKRVDMGEKAYIGGEDMFIPSAFANKIFGTAYSENFVSVSEIASASGKHLFFDPIGFAMLSENENAVNTTKTDYDGYADFYTVTDAIGTITWNDINENEFDRDLYIKKWRALLTIPEKYKEGDLAETYKAYLKKTVVGEDGNGGLFNTYFNLDFTAGNVPFKNIDITSQLKTGGEERYSRNDISYTTNLLAVYKNMITMAQYANLCENEDEKNSIAGGIALALEYLYGEHYTKEINFYNYAAQDKSKKGDWTKYQLDLPRAYSKLLCLMSDFLSDETICKYAYSILDRTIDPTTRQGSNLNESYTNRIWRTEGFFSAAVLANDYKRMNYAMRYLNQVFIMRSDTGSFTDYPKNGFYEDGSMLFHNGVAYNHGYGDAYLTAVSELITLTEGTPFSVKKVYGYDNVYSIIEKCFYPFLAENSRMHMVMGRQTVQDASLCFSAVLNIAARADESKRNELLDGLKSAYYKYIGLYTNIKGLTYTTDGDLISCAARACLFYENAENFLEDTAVQPPQENAAVFYNMDRALQSTKGYTAGVAMSSERVQKYESIGTKNAEGWYTGDGMLYIYLGDRKQYTSVYFENIDPYRIPGTTVDETVRSKVSAGSGYTSNNSFAGGAADLKTAVCGYSLSTAPLADVKEGIHLTGNKSYFFLNGKIVCIGSNITGGEGNVCTVIDNRIIDTKKTE